MDGEFRSGGRLLVANLLHADESLGNCYILLFVSRTFDDPKAGPLSEDRVIRRGNEERRGKGGFRRSHSLIKSPRSTLPLTLKNCSLCLSYNI